MEHVNRKGEGDLLEFINYIGWMAGIGIKSVPVNYRVAKCYGNVVFPGAGESTVKVGRECYVGTGKA